MKSPNKENTPDACAISPGLSSQSTSAAARRGRYGAQSVILLIAVACCWLFAVLIAERIGSRFDLTSTGEHRLGERASRIVASLDGPYEIVVCANAALLDQHAARRTRDVLDAFAHASDNIRTTIIDIGTTRGSDDLDALIARLIERPDSGVDRYESVVNEAIDSAGRLATGLAGLSASMREGLAIVQQPGTPNAELLYTFFESGSALGELFIGRLNSAIQLAQKASETSIARTPANALDEAALGIANPIAELAEELVVLERRLAQIAEAGQEYVPESVARLARSTRPVSAELRDLASRTAAELRDTPQPDVIRIARILERTSVVLVIGPGGGGRSGDGTAIARRTLAAVDGDSIFPPAPPPHAAGSSSTPRADPRLRAEELLASALGSLGDLLGPRVVIVHGAPTRLAPSFGPVQMLADRLALRGGIIDEWAVMVDEAPPRPRSTEDERRPTVYATVGVPPTAPDAERRAVRLAQATTSLLRSGESVLASFAPSLMPSIGDRDPMATAFEPFGIRADTGKTLLRLDRGPDGGSIVQADTRLTPGRTDAPDRVAALARSVEGLGLQLWWATPLKLADTPPSRVRVLEPLLSIGQETTGGGAGGAGGQASAITRWAESEWRGFAQIPPSQHARVLDPPRPDVGRDDIEGPWTLAAAVEVADPAFARPQRIVAVGSNGWYFDEIAQQYAGVIDGRPVLAAPGNAELFESAVWWLAGQEELISRSSAARAVPRIPAMSPERVSALRWGLVAGLPAGVLALGAFIRILRR